LKDEAHIAFELRFAVEVADDVAVVGADNDDEVIDAIAPHHFHDTFHHRLPQDREHGFRPFESDGLQA